MKGFTMELARLKTQNDFGSYWEFYFHARWTEQRLYPVEELHIDTVYKKYHILNARRNWQIENGLIK